MFNGYLCLGGNELGNNARAQGYAESATCPATWFVGDQCESLPEALGDAPYDISGIEDAPWYDPADESTSRFYGAYITSLGDISSSTREGSYTEGILPGGVPGRSRHAGKSFRVRAWLTAAGEDALQTGHDWLDAALQAQSCGTHAGSSCGATDLTLFTTCPPARARVTDFTAWEQQAQNLFTNPSAERAGGAYEVRRNHAPNPRAVSTGTAWSARHGGGGTSTLAYKTTGGTPPTPGLVTFVEAERTADATPGNSSWLRVSQFLPDVVTAEGEVWTLSAWVRSNVAGRVGVTLAYMNSTGGFAVNEASQTVDTPGNVWHRVSVTVTAAAGAQRVRIEGSMSASVTGDQVKATGFLLEKVGAEAPYFDGITPGSDPDFAAAWTGAEDASPSTLTVMSVTGASGSIGDQNYYQSQDSPFTGNYVLRTQLRTTVAVAVTPQTPPLAPGTVYTLIMRARAVDRDQQVIPRLRQAQGPAVTLKKGEWTEVRLTAAAGSGTVSQTGFLVPNASGHQVGDRIDLDAYAVIEGAYTGPWFDGGTFPDEIGGTARTRWLGAENNSSSIYETREEIQRPQNDEEYADSVSPLIRHLHDVTCISGPLEIETRRSSDGIHWGRLVEFTLYAGKPWFYGETRRLNRDTTPAIVVQDAPFNLAIVPSAELAGPAVVAATNYSTNPSVEVDAVDWAPFSQQVTGSVVGARVTGELAAAGSASHRTTFTASAAGTDGALGVEHTVTIPATTALTRMSVTLWASALVFSGTAALGQIVSYVMWYNGTTFLSSQDVGTFPASGGPLSVKSLKPPVGATKAVIRAYVNVPSYSNGAVIRFYADAAGVTVP